MQKITAKIVISVDTDGPFFMKEIREAASHAIAIDLHTENSENKLPTGGEINGVTIDWNTLMIPTEEDAPQDQPQQKTATPMSLDVKMSYNDWHVICGWLESVNHNENYMPLAAQDLMEKLRKDHFPV